MRHNKFALVSGRCRRDDRHIGTRRQLAPHYLAWCWAAAPVAHAGGVRNIASQHKSPTPAAHQSRLPTWPRFRRPPGKGGDAIESSVPESEVVTPSGCKQWEEQMRRLLFVLLGSLGAALSAIVLAAGPAAADSPHFISEGTASISSTGAYHVANFKEAGLGNTVSTEAITLSATAMATYLCVNGGGNHPKATNKESVTTPITNTQSFPVRNGQTTGSISVGPPAAGPFQPPCSPPQTVVLAFVSYTNVELIGLAGDTSAEPDLSACLVTGKLAAAGCP